MSVLKVNQNSNSPKFLDNFHNLRREMNNILSRDFGFKPRSYNVQLIKDIYNLDAEDETKLNEIAKKYGMTSFEIEKYPEWLVDSLRKEVRYILKHIAIEIELANNIYLEKETYHERRLHWNLAIGYCNALKDEINEIIQCFKVKPSAFIIVAKMLDDEIKLLKGVRKSDNKILK